MPGRFTRTTILTCGCAALFLAALTVRAQAPQQPADPYQGTAHPPTSVILTDETSDEATTTAKPSPAHPAAAPATATSAPASAQTSAPAAQPTSLPTSTDPSATFPAAAPQATPTAAAAPVADPDGDIVHPSAAEMAETETAPARPAPVALAARSEIADPDSDIVHPLTARPGQLAEGTMFQVELLDRLSSDENTRGDRFHAKVLNDVLQNGKVLIPAGSTLEGRISSATSGHLAGHGSLRLSPDTLILPDSTRLSMHAEVSAVPGTSNRIDDEGGINPGSRKERAGIEYGAVAGAGAATGAVFAGPVGALTGGLIGAGMVTTHLMVSHPQTTLDPGTKILFTLTAPLDLIPGQSAAQNQASR